MPAETEDMERCVIHAGSDKIHKLRYRKLTSLTTLNRTMTECGTLTTYMSRISAEEAQDLPDSHRCKRCFSD